MVRDVIATSHQTESHIRQSKLGFSTQQAQESIYQFLLEIVRKQPPSDVLKEFRYVFIDYNSSAGNPEAIQAVSRLIFTNHPREFLETLKRSCYILINNWYTSRNHSTIKELIEIFNQVDFQKKTLSPTLSRQRLWLLNFIQGKEYEELKLFVSKYQYSDQEHWSNRYTSYLLVPQYTNLDNPIEQREAARTLSQKLKDQFKFELAMYTARSQSSGYRHKIPQNPTALGDSVLHFIKRIVAKSGTYSHENLAHIFIEQTKGLCYKDFKMALQKYLIFSVENKDLVQTLNQKLAEKLETLYESYHEETLDDALLLRTSNKVLEYLTTEDQEEPSPLFILLMSQGHHLTLVIVLVKIILICPNARAHLETCVAKLIRYYSTYPEAECKWVIIFFEVFKITFAIHADNVHYNLIKMEDNKTGDRTHLDLDAYRVFSQLRE
ncbi:MAG TPA: hypothetical protein DD379_23305 [Cyanobacteria bacterium UBA11162]|nr:hypothetical protein [Cyanobacteria bacterium UBA12227]HAX88910.1 hypothetical protein [Cyanobacteria bacterium UBA11370]HBL14259.1 hypothetical protein [Cyanobacteria bacterium UBA11162]